MLCFLFATIESFSNDAIACYLITTRMTGKGDIRHWRSGAGREGRESRALVFPPPNPPTPVSLGACSCARQILETKANQGRERFSIAELFYGNYRFFSPRF